VHADRKQIARRIFARTLALIDVRETVEASFTRSGSMIRACDATIDLSKCRDVLVVAIGKAAHGMVDGLAAAISPDVNFRGVVSSVTAPEHPHSSLKYFSGGHPVPNAESMNAGRAILALLKDSSEGTAIFFLLSGGGSALAELPLEPQCTLEDVQAFHRGLVGCGGSIDEINAVRKHASAVKGGRLAAAAPLAQKITLAISDVPPGKESALASGPTLPDPTTWSDAIEVLRRYDLLKKLPRSYRAFFESREARETPKVTDPAFNTNHFQLVLGMHELFHAAHRAAEAEGFFTCCDNSTDDWPLEKAAAELLRQLDALRAVNPGRPVALIADGEVSSPVRGTGIGGRNAAFTLACAQKIAGQPICVLSAGTDGIDGNSAAAGAVADGETIARAQQAGMEAADHLQRSDAFTYFKKLSDAVETGPTGINLRDLRILLAG
jgi:hydroxypyruvate reductase